MSPDSSDVRSLVLPLENGGLLLPGVVIAEVISFIGTDPIEGAPDWVMGRVYWRGNPLVLISMEAAMGDARPTGNVRARVAILYALTGNSSLRHYGLLIQGIPRVALVAENSCRIIPEPRPRPNIHATISLDSGPAVVPDLDALELSLLKTGIGINAL